MKKLIVMERDQSKPFDYSLPYDQVRIQMACNSGNSVFQYTFLSMLDEEYDRIAPVEIVWGGKLVISDERIERIRSGYDAVLVLPANLLSHFANHANLLNAWAEFFRKVKIPVYAIGLGCQSDNEYSMEFLKPMEKAARNYLTSILIGGGCIGIRGFFTAGCLERLGLKEGDFTVTGCPSLFFKGPDLQVVKKQKPKERNFTPVINGFRAWNSLSYRNYFKRYPRSFFVCQDEFYKLLYTPENLGEKEEKYLADSDWVSLYEKDRIRLYGDFPSWYHDLERRKIDFSFGCRIHGNIVPLLLGVPCYLDAFDSRVRELGEYFHIPLKRFEGDQFPDPLELLEKTDFTDFNREFSDKFKVFQDFMNRCGLKWSYGEEPPDWKAPVIPKCHKRIIRIKAEAFGGMRSGKFVKIVKEKLGRIKR